jgi:hypothetical protein
MTQNMVTFLIATDVKTSNPTVAFPVMIGIPFLQTARLTASALVNGAINSSYAQITSKS